MLEKRFLDSIQYQQCPVKILQGGAGQKKLHNKLNFFDKSTGSRRGLFHKYPFIAMGYENGATPVQVRKVNRSQLRTLLLSITFGPGTYSKTQIPE
ncbi:hypothetical protein [uncultured Desulfobulbus sp.]|uniref:hypothetical protein n=1 Tax=uncultured Desulfobulbus sp. TaxID=239745 RepID=UPI0029C8A4F6|nr:hypothetical protein [uncultured Desulfobulbus sp.]